MDGKEDTYNAWWCKEGVDEGTRGCRVAQRELRGHRAVQGALGCIRGRKGAQEQGFQKCTLKSQYNKRLQEDLLRPPNLTSLVMTWHSGPEHLI